MSPKPLESGIYRILNTATGKAYYGSSACLRNRWRRHLLDLRKGQHHSRHLQRAWNKYGEAAFVFEVLVHTAEEHLFALEQVFLNMHPKSYNAFRDAKGPRGHKFSAETCRRMGESRRGKPRGPMSEEQRQLLREIHTGMGHTLESRKKMSASRMGMKRAPEATAKMIATKKSRPVSPLILAQIERLAESNTGKPISDEHRKKISTFQKGRPKSAETRRRIAEAARKRARGPAGTFV